MAAVVAAAFPELLFPPGRSFEGAGLIPLFAKTFGCLRVRVDFEVRIRGHEGFSPPLAPSEIGGIETLLFITSVPQSQAT